MRASEPSPPATGGPGRLHRRAAAARARAGRWGHGLASLARGRLRDRRLAWLPAPGPCLWLPAGAGAPVAAVLRLAGHGPGPAVILVHGSHGPLPLYDLLAGRLAAHGISTLLLELPGFGRSPAPPPPWPVAPFTGRPAVAAALDWLRRHPGIDPAQVSLVGHSFGASVAVAAGRLPGVRAVVALGPTRRVEERFIGAGAREGEFWRARFALARGLDPWPSLSFVQAVTRQVALECRRDDWQRDHHPPLLLIDGERESAGDRAFLAGLARTLTPPVDYRTVPGADHYLNCSGLGRLVCYDRRAVATSVAWIVEWITGGARP